MHSGGGWNAITIARYGGIFLNKKRIVDGMGAHATPHIFLVNYYRRRVTMYNIITVAITEITRVIVTKALFVKKLWKVALKSPKEGNMRKVEKWLWIFIVKLQFAFYNFPLWVLSSFLFCYLMPRYSAWSVNLTVINTIVIHRYD